MSTSAAVDSELLAAARSLMTDRATGEVAAALDRVGVPSLLLKGPAIRHWLYEADEARSYSDCDLLVPERDFARAERTLVALGFDRALDDEQLARGGPVAAHTWGRERDGVFVDLHRSLVGVQAKPGAVWSSFRAGAVPLHVGGAEVLVPGAAASAFHIAIHAAKHGRTAEQPLRDLARSIDHFDVSTWRDSLALARELGAAPSFAAGLRLLPRGRLLADRIDAVSKPSVTALLTAQAAPGPAIRLEQFRAASGWRPKALFLARTLFPSPFYMRLFWPLARRSALGLTLAYAIRPFGLVRDAVPAWRAWRRARRMAGRTRASRMTQARVAAFAPVRLATLPELRIPMLRAAWWTWRAARGARRHLRHDRLDTLVLPAVPDLPWEGTRGVDAVLRRGGYTCLVCALVRQAWEAAHGRRRDLIIGVNSPSDDFQAHAWLEGDPAEGHREFRELLRRSAA